MIIILWYSNIVILLKGIVTSCRTIEIEKNTRIKGLWYHLYWQTKLGFLWKMGISSSIANCSLAFILTAVKNSGGLTIISRNVEMQYSAYYSQQRSAVSKVDHHLNSWDFLIRAHCALEVHIDFVCDCL